MLTSPIASVSGADGAPAEAHLHRLDLADDVEAAIDDRRLVADVGAVARSAEPVERTSAV